MEGTDCQRPRALREDARRNQERITLAARDLFAAHGLEATLNEVAHHAGVGVGTVYRRFATKEQLLEAIFEDGVNQMVSIAESALTVDDSWEGLIWFVEQSCALTAADRGLREILATTSYGGRRVALARERLDPLVSQLVHRACRDGYLRPEIEPTDMPILNLLAGAVSAYVGGIEPDLWRRYIRILLDGMCHRNVRGAPPVDALDDEQMNRVMRNWRPGG